MTQPNNILYGDFAIKKYSRNIELDSNCRIKSNSQVYMELEDLKELSTYSILVDTDAETVLSVTETFNNSEISKCYGMLADIYYGYMFRDIQNFIIENGLVYSQKNNDGLFLYINPDIILH